MIYTVTANPSLDYHVHLAAPIRRGEIARSAAETIVAAGKGVNVSVVLHHLGAPTRALGFLAGESGRMFESLLADCPHDFTFLDSGMTRINVKLYDGEETAINAAGPAVTKSDCLRLCEKLSALCENDTLVLSGNLQQNAPFSYVNFAEIAVKHGAKFVVDTTGSTLLDCLPLRPYFIKPNLEELGELFSTKVKDRDQALCLCEKLQQQGARNVLVSMGSGGALLLSERGERYFAICEKKEPVRTTVGAGDSLVAGFLAAQSHSTEFALSFAVASGSATVYAGSLANKGQIESLLPYVKVTKL